MFDFLVCYFLHRHRWERCNRWHPAIAGFTSLTGADLGVEAYHCDRCKAVRFINV